MLSLEEIPLQFHSGPLCVCLSQCSCAHTCVRTHTHRNIRIRPLQSIGSHTLKADTAACRFLSLLPVSLLTSSLSHQLTGLKEIDTFEGKAIKSSLHSCPGTM